MTSHSKNVPSSDSRMCFFFVADYIEFIQSLGFCILFILAFLLVRVSVSPQIFNVRDSSMPFTQQSGIAKFSFNRYSNLSKKRKKISMGKKHFHPLQSDSSFDISLCLNQKVFLYSTFEAIHITYSSCQYKHKTVRINV